MSLDYSMSRSNRGERGQGRVQRGRGKRGAFPHGRTENMLHKWPRRVNDRPSSYTIAKYFHQSFSRTKDSAWQSDLFEDSLIAGGLGGIETGTKLYISNLDYGVTNEDLTQLFSEIGYLKRYAVHYDSNGRSRGSAEVVFTRRTDALAAIKRYDNVLLDGKPMKVEIIGTNFEMPVSGRVNVIRGANGRGRRTVVLTPEVGRSGGSAAVNHKSDRRSHQGFRRGRGRPHGWGRGRGRKHTVKKSADELDKELGRYHTEATHT